VIETLHALESEINSSDAKSSAQTADPSGLSLGKR
jgi:hypothetical protein